MAEVSLSLYNLIHSLTGAEKKQFYHYASKHVIGKEENSYMLLFDNIAENKLYDEEKIKKQLSGKIKNFASTKNYLYELILKSLQANKSNFDIEDEINNYLETIKILEQKEQYEKCFQQIKKAKQVAKEKELFDKLQELISYELKVFFHLAEYTPEEFSSKLDELKYTKNLNDLNQRALINSYEMIYLTNQSHPNKKENNNKLSTLLNSSTEILREKESLHKTKFISLETIAILNGYTGQITEAIKHYEKLLLLYSEQKQLLEQYPSFYAKYCNAYLQLCGYYAHINKTELAKEMLHTFENTLNKKQLGLRALIIQAKLFTTEINYMLNSNNLEEFSTSQVEDFLQKNKNNNSNTYLAIVNHLLILFLLKKDFKKMGKVMVDTNNLFEAKKYDIRKHKFCTLKFLLFFERRDYEQAELCYKKEIKPFTEQNLGYTFENEFYSRLLEIIKDNRNSTSQFELLNSLLQKHKTNTLVGGLYLLKWVRGKLKEIV
ncbi:MAG: hypothetical protein J0M08_04205 [Bacteroidetes bacterium]|nr:hypothetical protein [Bacteroidota bacterium]